MTLDQAHNETPVANTAQQYPATLIVYQSGWGCTGGGYDKYVSYDALAVWIPSERILVSRYGGRAEVLCGPIYEMYTTIQGDPAEKLFKQLTATGFASMDLKRKILKQENTQVDQVFVNWAKALHAARNPPPGLQELMNHTKFTDETLQAWKSSS